MVGKVIAGRYQVEELLGQGGMARVYKAHDLNLGREVAVKVLLDNIASDSESRERFRREARAAAALSHPNIVQVYDFIESPEGTYIVMELVRGQDVRSLLERDGRFSVDEALRVSISILSALQVAHERGLIHRDISARNVLIGQDGQVRVSDFGIARIIGERTLTQTGDLVGSVQYISPEQARGEEADAKADIYEVGVLLYEMLTGKLPFAADNAVQLALKHIRQTAAPPSDLRPEISLALDSIVLKAMAKEPKQRFASATEMAQALEALKGQVRPAAVPTGLGSDDEDLDITRTMVRGSILSALEEDNRSQRSAISPADYDEDYGEVDDAIGEDSTEEADAPADDTKRSRAGKGAIISLIIVAIVALTGGIIWAVNFSSPRLAVPGVVGKSLSEATKILDEAGFRLEVQRRQMSSTAEADSVLEQDPAAGSMASTGSVVYVVICGSQERVVVPNLDGLSAERAQQELEKVGLRSVVKPEEHSTVAVGIVFRQEPGAGTTVERDYEVLVVVSSGLGKFTLPDLSGLSESQARNVVEELGGKLSVAGSKASTTLDKGLVLEQKPAAGNPTAKGQTILVILSSGRGVESLPDFVGMSVADAKDKAAAAGLKVVVEGGGSRQDIVSRQSPAAGEPSSQDTVTLFSDAVAVVPNVCGLTYKEAVARLADAGLQAGTVAAVTSSGVAGTIVEQSIEPGSQVDLDTAVDLVLAASPEPPSSGGQSNSDTGRGGASSGGSGTDAAAPPTSATPIELP